MKLKLLGVDPSLNNMGLAFATYDTDIDNPELRLSVQALALVKTEPTKDKKVVRKNSDDLDRAKVLHAALQKAAAGRTFAMVEVPVGSQSARAMASYGICVGVLASCPIPMIQVKPDEVKIAGAGHKTAAKEEMIEWAMSLYPSLNWLMAKVRGKVKPIAANEHLADAIAALHAGIRTDEFQRAVAVLGAMPLAA